MGLFHMMRGDWVDGDSRATKVGLNALVRKINIEILRDKERTPAGGRTSAPISSS